jgi:anti-sigma factor RsiW
MSTPHTPHPSHVDVDTLADLEEGLLEADQVSSVAEHLAGCAECRARREALDDVQLLLRDRGAEVDAAAPEDVVRRLDDAFAAAAMPLPTASATVTPLTASTTRARQPWRTRVLQAAAVFVLVAAVGALGYGGIRAVSGGNSSGTTAADSGAGAGQAPEPNRETARKYVIASSHRDYNPKSLRSAVPGLLSGTFGARTEVPKDTAVPEKSPTGGGGAAGSAADPQRLRGGKALAACVANLTGGPETPLAVDVGARFENKPATIIVLPDPDDASFVNAYAVAPDCPTGTWLDYEKVALP